MIMGVSVDEVIERIDEPHGLSHIDTIVAMNQFGMFFAPLMHASLWDGWHLIFAPSLNYIGGMHAVLLHWDSDLGEMRIVDPAIGKRYAEDGSDMKSWAEVILVRPSGSLQYFDRHTRAIQTKP